MQAWSANNHVGLSHPSFKSQYIPILSQKKKKLILQAKFCGITPHPCSCLLPSPLLGVLIFAHQCILPHKMRPSHQRLYDWFVRKTIKNARMVCSARPARESRRRPASSTLESFTVATAADDTNRNTIFARASRGEARKETTAKRGKKWSLQEKERKEKKRQDQTTSARSSTGAWWYSTPTSTSTRYVPR